MKYPMLLVLMLFMYSSVLSADNIVHGSAGNRLKARVVAKFSNPWSMTFIDQDLMLVTSKLGALWLVSAEGKKLKVTGVPKVAVGGQGGLGDVLLHPDFLSNSFVYLSLVEASDNGRIRGALVVRGKLEISKKPKLTNIQRIWTQLPKTQGLGHFSHRIAFGPKDSKQSGKLFITSGDRQEQLPAQSLNMALGKIIRLNDDGSLPIDNPFQDNGELARSFWSLGHRNALGIAFDGNGRLWSHEMGPKHGDEFNLIRPSQNYGWPLVSEGNHYNGNQIPKHQTRSEFTPPAIYWIPTIAPSGLVFYSNEYFNKWNGNAFIGGLKSKALIRIEFEGKKPKEAERFEWGSRVREVEQGLDGTIWVLEDAPQGRLIQFTHP